MARRKLWFAISGVVIVVSLGSLVTRGLNLGIDFKGGVQITFKTPKPTPISKVRVQTQLVGQKDAVVQGRGKAYGSESYKSFQIRLKKLNADATEQAEHGARPERARRVESARRTSRRASAGRSRSRRSSRSSSRCS